jgi:hypothetical protein
MVESLKTINRLQQKASGFLFFQNLKQPSAYMQRGGIADLRP